MCKIVILDYGYGNLFSIKSALVELGFNSIYSKNIEQIIKAKIIILPGVGSFHQAMKAIKKLKLDIAIKKALDNNAKILGICLGYQMLFEQSEEFGVNKGLGLIKGKVRSLKKINTLNCRVPNVGWRPIIVNKENKILKNYYNGKMVYFVHSFVPYVTQEKKVSTTIKFSGNYIHTSIHTANIVGFQFHPEKSGEVGLGILKETINFFYN